MTVASVNFNSVHLAQLHFQKVQLNISDWDKRSCPQRNTIYHMPAAYLCLSSTNQNPKNFKNSWDFCIYQSLKRPRCTRFVQTTGEHRFSAPTAHTWELTPSLRTDLKGDLCVSHSNSKILCYLVIDSSSSHLTCLSCLWM